MKTLNLIFTFAFTLTLLLSSFIYSQNITGTLGTGGLFSIRTTSDTLFRISQSTGNVLLKYNIELSGLTSSTSARGVITKNGLRFIHNYQAPGTDGFNTFIGLEAGNFTMSGSTNQASYNTAVGNSSLKNLTSGGFNSAFGAGSLLSNTTGYTNSAFGYTSLALNTSGYRNSAFGYRALYNNTTGNENSALGYDALFYNNTGSFNSSLGHQSLYSSTTGNYNTAIGYSSGSAISTGSNNIAIGYNAQVPTGSASNQIRLGNTSITYAGVQVAWTVTSDRRYKDNITPIGLGLGFISKLNPVSYQRKNDENKKTEYGLIAQEVEQVLKDLGIENHAMLTVTDEGMYELRYNDLIAPMIKAIQELKEQNDQLKNEKDTEIAKLKEENLQLRNEIQSVKSLSDEVEKLKQIVNSLNSKSAELKLTSSVKEEK
jgi:hypothetical protein